MTKNEDLDIISGLFEQLLIFDKIYISTNRINFTLFFLIDKLGINIVEQLIDEDYINFMLWTPVIFSGIGRQLDNGRIDEFAMYGQQPIMAGEISKDDLDIESNINKALNNFPRIHEDRKRIFRKKAVKSYLVPEGMELSTNSTKLIIDAYNNDNLNRLGLPYEKDANQLNKKERMIY